jgi:hypothetical protein
MGAWTELVDYTVPSNTTSVVLNTFGTITKNDFIKVVMTHVNSTSNNNDVTLVANSSVSTNYHRQFLFGAGSNVNAGRNNAAGFLFTRPSQTSKAVSFLKISENDRLNYFTNYNAEIGSSLENVFNYGTSSGATFTSGITSLTFTSNQTNGLGTGSRIQIYRLDAEKVADITVASNTTQVDISSLSIGKDSEYLLVSDVVNPQTTTIALDLMVNDNTTVTNYYSQLIFADGSSAGAARNNRARTSIVRNVNEVSNKTILYSHIKLSEIGAYTSQNYPSVSYGSNTVFIENSFVSSTAENITSITKLNIVASASNAIGSGSRFILYKVK